MQSLSNLQKSKVAKGAPSHFSKGGKLHAVPVSGKDCKNHDVLSVVLWLHGLDDKLKYGKHKQLMV